LAFNLFLVVFLRVSSTETVLSNTTRIPVSPHPCVRNFNAFIYLAGTTTAASQKCRVDHTICMRLHDCKAAEFLPSKCTLFVQAPPLVISHMESQDCAAILSSIQTACVLGQSCCIFCAGHLRSVGSRLPHALTRLTKKTFLDVP
jgi:hypothetical protein